ncbi:hypothetical protein [Bifidobacterium pseudolongum]|uniref:hypothetical protein n=1 Tax=Bifidobacterium pseudolongum TaxID=1694 RepID=UPI0010204C0D|nr:hypothetical protein [Bifidobacterium pseudolongum]
MPKNRAAEGSVDDEQVQGTKLATDSQAAGSGMAALAAVDTVRVCVGVRRRDRHRARRVRAHRTHPQRQATRSFHHHIAKAGDVRVAGLFTYGARGIPLLSHGCGRRACG